MTWLNVIIMKENKIEVVFEITENSETKANN